MKNKKKIGGFGSSEFLTIAMVCLILSWIVLSIAIQAEGKERYKVFVYDAKVLGTNAVHYKMEDENVDVIYMKELLQFGFLTKMKNPFNGKESCSETESKVVFFGDERKIFLRCGNFLIQEQDIEDKEIVIYQVSSWSEKKSNSKQIARNFYNYQIGKEYQLDEFVEEALFLHLFNQENKTSYQQVQEIPKQYNIISKKMYRNEKMIKKLKN